MSDSFILQGRYELIDKVTDKLTVIDKKVTESGKNATEGEKKFNNFNNAMVKFSKGLNTFGNGLTNVGKKLTTFVSVPLAGAGIGAFNLASDFQESLNKVEVACGDGADSVKEFSKTTLKNFGIAKGSALDMIATWSDMGTGMKLNQTQANDMSKALVGLAGDMSSFKNVKLEVAQTALTGIFTGETESLKQLGVVMTEANLQEFAYASGIKKKVSEMSQAEKVQLRYNFVMDATKNAHGEILPLMLEIA